MDRLSITGTCNIKLSWTAMWSSISHTRMLTIYREIDLNSHRNVIETPLVPPVRTAVRGYAKRGWRWITLDSNGVSSSSWKSSCRLLRRWLTTWYVVFLYTFPRAGTRWWRRRRRRRCRDLASKKIARAPLLYLSGASLLPLRQRMENQVIDLSP